MQRGTGRTSLDQPAGLADLDRAGQVLLCAARSWSEAGGTPVACAAFARAGLGAEALTAFAAALALLRTATFGTLDLRRPGHGSISRDEALLVTAVAALQCGEPWRTQRVLAQWLPPHAVPRGTALLARLASTLAASGLRMKAIAPARMPAAPMLV